MKEKDVNSCGCCEGLSVETPARVYNRPGLKAISYRIGNYSQFRESLLARLSSADLPALWPLTTRSNEDFTIALLDAWAVVSDVLTFYQERIANESYLNTAIEQRSILELARLIGYELRPGVAAGTLVAFTLEENSLTAAPAFGTEISIAKEEAPRINIDAGTKIQSIPGPGEEPQTFETIENIEANADWNAIRPRLSQPQLSISDDAIIAVKGTNNNLKAGDLLLIKQNGEEILKKKIVSVENDENFESTWLYLGASAVFPAFEPLSLEQPDGDLSDYPKKMELNPDIVNNLIQEIWTEEDFSTLLQEQEWPVVDLKESVKKKLSEKANSAVEVFVFRKRVSAFGYNAPKQTNYVITTHGISVPNLPSQWYEWRLDEEEGIMYLDNEYEEIVPESFIAVQKSAEGVEQAAIYTVDGVELRSRTAYGLSAKTTELKISPYPVSSSPRWWEESKTPLDESTSEGSPSGDTHTHNLTIVPTSESFEPEDEDLSSIRSLTIYAQSERLELAETPIEKTVSCDVVMLSQLYLHLKKGKTIILSGERSDLEGAYASEVRVIKRLLIDRGFTILVFDKPLAYEYVRKTVSINANIAVAAHGETAHEILGDGDARKTFQQFILKQPPLTYISASTASGTQSTLEIRVNDILWKEVPSLYGRAPDEKVYIARQNDEGQTTVTFGDGITGARLPGGQQNVKAAYRKGIGAKGLLKADQLSQLITRPLGVKAVRNPLPTNGAQDRELMADARRNANLTIFTLDRIVSLQDYEDFARAFAGIAKALATQTWREQKQSVHLTVAGYKGVPVSPDSELYKNLLVAIPKAGVPDVPVTLASYRPRFFRLAAAIQIHPDYLSEKVLDATEQELRTRFSFDERKFGQSVTLSEVISVMQKVEGVLAVDIDYLHRSNEPPTRKHHLRADVPRPGQLHPFPAELLTLDPQPLNLKEMP